MAARTARTSNTAELHRFVQLNDRADTQFFTFIVPSHLTRGFLPEVTSKEFLHGNQRWCIRFERHEKHIGAFLILKSGLPRMTIKLDYSFTVLNQEHFTRNESFVERSVDFTADKSTRGRPSFIEVSDLSSRNFLFDDWKFLVELDMHNATTVYTEEIYLPQNPKELAALDTLETSYFTFGCCDWNVTFYFNGPPPIDSSEMGDEESMSNSSLAAESQIHMQGKPTLAMNRHNRLEHCCRVSYRVNVTWADMTVDTGQVDKYLDTKGGGRLLLLDSNLFHVAHGKYPIIVTIEMMKMCHVSLVELVPTSRNKNCTRCYDTDQQEWLVQSDILGRLVKLNFFYADIANVPRDFCRAVCWEARIMPHDKNRSSVKALSSPYSAYFSQKDSDEGYEVALDLPVEEVCDSSSGYTNPTTGSITIEIDWLHSHLLYHDYYHVYDNISRLHKHQMSREIQVLQAENYALEKQVHSYQMSIARKDPNGIDILESDTSSSTQESSAKTLYKNIMSSTNNTTQPHYNNLFDQNVDRISSGSQVCSTPTVTTQVTSQAPNLQQPIYSQSQARQQPHQDPLSQHQSTPQTTYQQTYVQPNSQCLQQLQIQPEYQPQTFSQPQPQMQQYHQNHRETHSQSNSISVQICPSNSDFAYTTTFQPPTSIGVDDQNSIPYQSTVQSLISPISNGFAFPPTEARRVSTGDTRVRRCLPEPPAGVNPIYLPTVSTLQTNSMHLGNNIAYPSASGMSYPGSRQLTPQASPLTSPLQPRRSFNGSPGGSSSNLIMANQRQFLPDRDSVNGPPLSAHGFDSQHNRKISSAW